MAFPDDNTFKGTQENLRNLKKELDGRAPASIVTGSEIRPVNLENRGQGCSQKIICKNQGGIYYGNGSKEQHVST